VDRLAILAHDLTSILEEIHEEAERREMRGLDAPLAWLAEANGWLRHELARSSTPVSPEPVPFTYIPVEYRH
jgi:hypothetical protein